MQINKYSALVGYYMHLITKMHGPQTLRWNGMFIGTH